MLAAPTGRVLKKKQPRSKLAVIWTVAILVTLLGFLGAMMVSMEILRHPNLHPRIFKVIHWLMPNYSKDSSFIIVWLSILLLFFQFSIRALAPLIAKWSVLKNGRLSGDGLKLNSYLNRPFTEEYHELQPIAWQKLKDVLPGLLVKIPDLRAAKWELLGIDSEKKEIRLEMWYVQNPIGIKVSRLFPRKLNCVAKLSGKGTCSDVEFTFTANSPMDYQNVHAIISSTTSQLRTAMNRRLIDHDDIAFVPPVQTNNFQIL